MVGLKGAGRHAQRGDGNGMHSHAHPKNAGKLMYMQ